MWISRRAWEDTLRGAGADSAARTVLEAERDRLLGEIVRLRASYEEIVRQVIDLKREGFHPFQPVSVPEVPATQALPDRVMAAIRSLAHEGEPLFDRLVADAWRLMEDTEGDEDKVVRATLRGGAYKEVPSW